MISAIREFIVIYGSFTGCSKFYFLIFLLLFRSRSPKKLNAKENKKLKQEKTDEDEDVLGKKHKVVTDSILAD